MSSIRSRACRLLDLGDDAGPAIDQPAGLDHVVRPLHEGQGHPVDAELEAEGEVGAVLVGQRREVAARAGHVHALAVADGAADDDAGVDVAVGHDFVDAQAEPAVVEEQFAARA